MKHTILLALLLGAAMYVLMFLTVKSAVKAALVDQELVNVQEMTKQAQEDLLKWEARHDAVILNEGK